MKDLKKKIQKEKWRIISYIVWLKIFISTIYIFYTPQGAIRRELLFDKGINIAISAVIINKESTEYGLLLIDRYLVYVNSIEEIWEVRYLTNYYAAKIE